MNGIILVVEDDPITKRFYEIVFKHCELDLVQTESFDEIFNILEKKNVKVVILDVSLRNTTLNGKIISGLEISKMIKENNKYGNPKILLVSAYNLLKGENDFAKSKADEFIRKPITDFNEFLQQVRKLVNG